MHAAESRSGVSIIVPVHKGGESFARCLDGVRATDPAPRDVVVVADGAIAEDVRIGRAAGAQVIELPDRSGPARARNVGAQHARGDILFFVDSDVVVPADALTHVMDAFERPSAPAALIGSYDDVPAGTTFLSQYKNLQHHYVHQRGREQASTFWGACGAIRRETFLELGGFDERYCRPCVEDIELGYRLRRAGKEIRLCHRLQVKHLKVWTAISLLEADFLYRALPWTELILRHRSAPNDLNLNWSGRASACLSVLLLAGLAGAAWSPWLLAVAAGASGGLLALNASFYRFLRRRRGGWFALRAIPWHWFYHLYSSVGFMLAVARHLLRLRAAPWLRPDRPRRPADVTAGT
ncbi:MAG: glycosyltransferase [Candidatus Eisenbacteria bacterium]